MFPHLPVLTVNNRTFDILARYMRGESCPVIARDIGVSSQRVYGMLQRVAERLAGVSDEPIETPEDTRSLAEILERSRQITAEAKRNAKALYPLPSTPEQRRIAQIAAQSAVRKGTLVRPATCSLCRDDSRSIEGHHTDYAKPLDVVWVCTACHASIHLYGKAAPD